MIGHWKNFDELESNLCLEELEAIIEAAREDRFNQNKFLAALKGVNLEESAADNRVEQIKARVAAKASGLSEEVYELGGLFGFESEGDE